MPNIWQKLPVRNNSSRPLKKGRLSAYTFGVKQNHTQADFTLYEAARQLKLPMEKDEEP